MLLPNLRTETNKIQGTKSARQQNLEMFDIDMMYTIKAKSKLGDRSE